MGRGGGRVVECEVAFGEGRVDAPLSLADEVVRGFFAAVEGFVVGVWMLVGLVLALEDVDLTEVMEGGRARTGGAVEGIGGARMEESDLTEADDLGRRSGSVEVVDATEPGLRDDKAATAGVAFAFSFPFALAVVDAVVREAEGTLVDARGVVGVWGRGGARDCVGVRAPLGFAGACVGLVVVGERCEVMEGASDAGRFEIEEVVGREVARAVPLVLGRRAPALLDVDEVLAGGVGAVVERVGKAFIGGGGGGVRDGRGGLAGGAETWAGKATPVAGLRPAAGVVAGDNVPVAVEPIPRGLRMGAAPRATPPRAPREAAAPRTGVVVEATLAVVILDVALAAVRREAILLVDTRGVRVVELGAMAGEARAAGLEGRLEEGVGAEEGRRAGVEGLAATLVLGVGRDPGRAAKVDFGVAARRSSTETSSSAGSRRQHALSELCSGSNAPSESSLTHQLSS